MKYIAVLAQFFSLTIAAPADPLIFNVNTRRALHLVDEHFISLTINPIDLLQGRPFGMGNNATIVMLKGLTPAYVRLGGPETNRYLFRSVNNPDDAMKNPDEIAITEEHWKGVNEFLRKAGMDMIACINSAHRGGPDGKWDPRNALDLVTFSDRMQYNITWQLGYEPTKEDGVSGTQLGKDFTQLRAILNAFPRYQQSKIVGPDVKVLHRKNDVETVLDLLIEAGPAISAVTWHPRWPHVSAITPSDTSEDGYDFPPDYLEWDKNHLHRLLQRAVLKKPFWIGEPRTEHTGSFAEGIIFARRLINAAKLGIEVVMKEPDLIDIAHPKPEYWIALLHKKTLGRTVLDARSLTNHTEVSLVVHCTNRQYDSEQEGGLTMMAVNTQGREQKTTLRGFPTVRLRDEVHHFVLTAGKELQSIFSQMTYLNGEPLLMSDGSHLPEITPKTKRFSQNLVIKLPPYSIGFFVVPQAKVPACQFEPVALSPFTLENTSPVEVFKTAQKGINDIRNMNEILVSKLLNPVVSSEDDKDASTSSEEEAISPKRNSRQITLEGLGHELKRHMDEVKELINDNVNALGRSAIKRTDSEENSLRAAEKKIDGLAEDLRNAMSYGDQATEFGKFLEMSGLKNDFGKMVRDERFPHHRAMPELDSDFAMDDSNEVIRSKRATFNILSKRSSDEKENEKQYKKLLDKHRILVKFDGKKLATIDFEKINKELQEELLLKEITVLERVEETLQEVIKSHMARHEAFEEMIKDELEQMKDEKLAALLEMKAKDGTKKTKKSQSNYLEKVEENSKLPPQKRETGQNNEQKNQEDQKKTDDPLEVFKTFLKKRKEEVEKRQNFHEKILELRNKIKEDLSKQKEAGFPLKLFQTPTTTVRPTTTKPTEANPGTTDKDESYTEKRRNEVLKYMADYIDNIKDEEQDESEEEIGGRKARKIEDGADERARTITSVLLNRVLDTIFPKKGQETFQNSTPGSMADDDEEEVENFSEESNSRETVESPASIPETVKKFREPAEKSMAPVETQSIGYDPISNNEVVGSADSTERDSSKNDEVSEQRAKREATEKSSSTTQKTDSLSPTDHEAVAGNTIVKKQLPSKNTTNEEAANVVDMAGETLRIVLDRVIPDAYEEAKKGIEGLALPDYLKNLGKIVEKFEKIDQIIKRVGDLAKDADKEDSPSEHIQKIKKNKREAETDEDLPTEIPYIDNPMEEPTTEQVENAADDVVTRATTTMVTTTESDNFFWDDYEKEIEMTDEEIKKYQDDLRNALQQDPIINKAMSKLAKEDSKKNINNEMDSHEANKIDEMKKPVLGNSKMTISKKPRLDSEKSKEPPSTPVVGLEKSIIAMVLENMLKFQDRHKPKPKRDLKSLLNKPLHTGGYRRSTRDSVAFPLRPPADEKLSQFLQQLQPGVYVVPSKDMENVHAEQTIRTEAGLNGKKMPKVVTLNIYFEEKQPEITTKQPFRFAGFQQQQTYKAAPSWMTRPTTSPQLPIIPQNMQALHKTHESFSYPGQAIAPGRIPAHQIIPKYYQNYGQDKSLYTGVYAEPQPIETQNIPSLPQFNGWAKSNIEPIYDNAWPTADKVREPETATPSPEEDKDEWDLQTIEKPTFPRKNLELLEDRREINPIDKKHAIEPYWNKTLKQIFKETAHDPFWKFLDPPEEDDEDTRAVSTEEEFVPEKSHEQEESKRMKRSLDNYQSNKEFSYKSLDLNTRPFGSEWNIPPIPDYIRTESREENSLGQSSFPDSDSLPHFQAMPDTFGYSLSTNRIVTKGRPPLEFRSRRSLFDNMIEKKISNERYPLENDHAFHKVLTRPKLRKFAESGSLEGSLASIQFKSPRASISITPLGAEPSNVNKNSYDGPPSAKIPLPETLSLEQSLYPGYQQEKQSQISQVQPRSISNTLFDQELALPQAAMNSVADSLSLPLKQIYEIVMDFFKKIASVSMY